MIDSADFREALLKLEIPHDAPIIAHASLSAFGYVVGGAEALIRGLMGCYEKIVMPGFTYKTMVTPSTGPANNGITYGQGNDVNRMAQFFDPGMPVDRLMGMVPETLRLHAGSRRSRHPILSFIGVGAESILESQTIQEPLKPIQMLMEAKGWVLLLGVDHNVNTSIHYAETLSHRKQFVRWALTSDGVVECPRFPGCSDGFPALATCIESVTRRVQLGSGWIQAIPLDGLIAAGRRRLEEDPLALLCDRSYCERCEAVRIASSAVIS